MITSRLTCERKLVADQELGIVLGPLQATEEKCPRLSVK